MSFSFNKIRKGRGCDSHVGAGQRYVYENIVWIEYQSDDVTKIYF